jgi:acetyl esterase
MLIYPAVDMSMESPSINENANAPILTKSVMAWFVNHYMNSDSDRTNINASPMLASDEQLKRMPPAIVITAQYDPLRCLNNDYSLQRCVPWILQHDHHFG